MEDDYNQNQSSIIEHIIELRSRIIKSLIFFIIAFISLRLVYFANSLLVKFCVLK